MGQDIAAAFTAVWFVVVAVIVLATAFGLVASLIAALRWQAEGPWFQRVCRWLRGTRLGWWCYVVGYLAYDAAVTTWGLVKMAWGATKENIRQLVAAGMTSPCTSCNLAVGGQADLGKKICCCCVDQRSRSLISPPPWA